MSTEDEFETIARHVRVEIPKIKGSRFIGDAFPASSEKEAKTCLAQVVSNFPDATHHCYAFSVERGDRERSSDGGEPGGTGGPPILQQIHASGLTNVLVVVTRYFGGTKLGTGGLIRAYGAAAKAALADCRRITQVVKSSLVLSFDYDDTSAAMRTIERFSADIASTRYGDRSTIEVRLPRSRIVEFQEAFTDALAGRGSIEAL